MPLDCLGTQNDCPRNRSRNNNPEHPREEKQEVFMINDNTDPIEARVKAKDIDNDPIEEAVQQAIDEANEEAIKDAISDALEDNVIETGYRMLMRDVDQQDEVIEKPEKNYSPEQKSVGSESKPSTATPRNESKNKEVSIGQKSFLTKEPSKRETLEAQKEGVEEFMQKETETLNKKILKSENNGTYLPDREKHFHEQRIQQAQQKISELENDIREAPQTEETDLESLPEWMQDLARIEQRNKEANLDTIRDTAAQISDGKNWGLNAINKIPEDQDNQIRNARRKSEEAFE